MDGDGVAREEEKTLVLEFLHLRRKFDDRVREIAEYQPLFPPRQEAAMRDAARAHEFVDVKRGSETICVRRHPTRCERYLDRDDANALITGAWRVRPVRPRSRGARLRGDAARWSARREGDLADPRRCAPRCSRSES